MTEWIREKGTNSPVAMSQWKIVPASWAAEAEKKERRLLFGDN
jgi:hypothetical protein